ncbi:MAG: hypothetical protein V4723_22045 [Pseudomonadota bacterium]
MKELFVNEWRRFGIAALVYALAHLALLALLYHVVDLFHLSWQLQLAGLCTHLLAALVLAIVQMGQYRAPGSWLWLLHRPLSPTRIFAALASASCALIAAAVGLPALLAVLAVDLLSAHTVDLRHYLLVLELVLLGAAAWLFGAYVIIQRSIVAMVALALPLMLLAHQASAATMLALSVLCVAWLAALTCNAFKPDRRAPPQGLALLLAAAPLQLGFYVLLVWGAALLFQNGQIALGVHPLHSKLPPKDGYIQATRADGRDIMLRGLAGATDPRAAQWQQDLASTDVVRFGASTQQYPVRHEFINLDELRIADEKRGVEWSFSHDAMRFHGRSSSSGASAGWLGLGGFGDGTPFPAVPLLRSPAYIMLPQALYGWDAETGLIHPLLRLTPPETLAREPQQIGDLLYVITNLRLITYARPVESTGRTMLQERLSTQWPHPFSDLDRVDVANMLDGTLVSASFGRTMQFGQGEASQTILFIDAGGSARLVAQRRLTHDYPALYEHLEWWISPLLHTVAALPDALIGKGQVLDKGKEQLVQRLGGHHPVSAWIGALTLSLLSALIAWNWLGSSRVSAGRKSAWISACLLMGPATLGTMMVLQARGPVPRVAESQSRLMGPDSSIADISPLV